MEINQLLTESRKIWGDKKLNLSQIIIRMGKIFGDICRYGRDEKTTDRSSENDLKKELGNMIVSTTRWCGDLGYAPQDCVAAAIAAQKYFRNYSGQDIALTGDIAGLLRAARQIWGDDKLALPQVIVRMGKVFGDICRYERNAKPADRAEGEGGLKKELGNIIFSTICWCDDLGYDPQECANIAIEAQKEYFNGINKH